MATQTDNLIDTVLAGGVLGRDEMSQVLEAFMAGDLPDDRVERFLVVMADRGETTEEIVGAATVMRRHAVRVECGAGDAIDTCGAGGDGISTFNVSTAAAIIAAGARGRGAKTGNTPHPDPRGSQGGHFKKKSPADSGRYCRQVNGQHGVALLQSEFHQPV